MSGLTPRRGRSLRRFTAEEVTTITKMYLEYAPTIAIARVLGRDEGTVRQKVLHLGLRRSNYVSRALGWAPPHIRERVSTLLPNEFLEECYAWRESQQEGWRLLSKEESERRFAELTATCAEIDASVSLTRNEKMVAKRIAGATLQVIGDQHGITRERVRQLTSERYIMRRKFKHPGPIGRPKMGTLQEELARLDRKREALLEKYNAPMRRLLAAWEKAAFNTQDEFLKRIGAVRNDQTVGERPSEPSAVEPQGTGTDT